MKQNWSVYVKAAYVASHLRVLTLKYHEIGTLLRELGTFLNRGPAGNHRETQLHPECDWLRTSHPDPPPIQINPEHVEGLTPVIHRFCWSHKLATVWQQEENLCKDGKRRLAAPSKARVPETGMVEQSWDAGEGFMELHLVLPNVSGSLFYLVYTFWKC